MVSGDGQRLFSVTMQLGDQNDSVTLSGVSLFLTPSEAQGPLLPGAPEVSKTTPRMVDEEVRADRVRRSLSTAAGGAALAPKE